ncbi:MAG: hypothetical protein H3Z52_01550 [archaeon]|nr:hypothetical protein [archaeon]MCP8319615.1 hypothetical protein [archaeon]
MEVKRGIVGGAIAGIVAGIVGWIVGALLFFVGLYGVTEPIKELPFPIEYSLLGMIVVLTVLGIIFGAIYAMLYDSLRGQGIYKGVFFGFLLWVIKDVAGALTMFDLALYLAIDFLILGIVAFLVYGAILGMVCERIYKY